MNVTPEVIFTIGPVEITETIIVTWVIMAILVALGYLGGKLFEKAPLTKPPSRSQNIAEMIVEGITSLVKSNMGARREAFVPFIGTLGAYLIIANLVGLIGIQPPTADINTTLALSFIVFVTIHFNGLRSKGLLRYLKGYTQPIWIMLPMNIVSEVAVPFSMAFRLYGNMLAGVIIVALVYMAIPYLVPVVFHAYFDLFSGLIQTFIFVMLAMVFIGMQLDDMEE